MEAWASEFLEVFKGRKVPVAEVVLRGIQQNPDLPVKEYSVDDLVQMTDGFIAMMAESLEGRSTEIRDTYVNSVIPGILAQGQPLASFVGQITMNCVLIYNELIPYVSSEHREKAGWFLINWMVQYNSDIVRIGLEVGVKA
jgi:hypothetical protein